jgi:hypothetical protein
LSLQLQPGISNPWLWVVTDFGVKIHQERCKVFAQAQVRGFASAHLKGSTFRLSQTEGDE